MVLYAIGSKRHFGDHLLLLLRENKNEDVKKLLEHYRPTSQFLTISHAKDSYQSTLLHYAAEYGNHHIVQYLIDHHGSEVDAREKFQRTPLMLAAMSIRGNVVDVLLKANANIHLKDFRGKSALRMILERETMIDVLFRNTTVEKMMRDVAPVQLYLCFMETGFTLYQAVTRQDVELVKLFLKHNCPVNDKDPETGQTALHAAVKNTNLEIVKMLVEHGANVDAVDSVEATPLYYLQKSQDDDARYLEILKILLNRATLLITGKRFQICPVLVQGCREAVEMVLKLVDDFNVCDRFGNTIAHYLARNKNANVIETLKGRDFNVNKRNRDLYTPLHVAAFKILPNTVKFLLENGAEVDPRGHSYDTPLRRLLANLEFVRLRGDAKKCVELLLAYGADPQDYDVLENFDWISKTHDAAVLERPNYAERVLTLMKPVLTYLAVRKVVEGADVIDKFTMSKINLQRSWTEYFSDVYEREYAEISKTTIYRNITLFEFLTGNFRRISVYVRNEELVSEVKKFTVRLNPLSPYWFLLKDRLAKLQNFDELKKKAVTVICRLFNIENNAIYSIAEYIVEYLTTQNMEYLQFVWFE